MLTLVNESRTLRVPRFVLCDGNYICGRSPESDLVVPHATVSRRHAELQVAGTRVKVVDLASRNGTFVDGTRIESAEVCPRQVVCFGEVAFVLLEGSGEDEDWESYLEVASTQTVGASQEEDTGVSQLTEAQQRVLELALTGLVEKQIARRLNISRHTAHNHLRNIYRLLGVHSRGELLAQLLPRK
jgi:DNA-binding CsgD family transcriptional regulator